MSIPIAGLTLAFAGTAGAASGLTCTTITGNVNSTITVSGCTGGNTGGSSQPITATALATGGTINWVSGSTTTIAQPQLTSISPTKCPGYVKPPKGQTNPNNPAAESFTANVTADTGDGMLLPATSTGEVCIAHDGTITALKPMKTTWTASSIACTTISGNAGSTITISGCTGGNTGGSSEPISGSALAGGGTITWVSGGSTTISAPTLTATSAKSCPGYVKNGANNPSADKISGTVTADTGDGLKLPGSYKGEVCIASDLTVTNAPGKSLTAK